MRTYKITDPEQLVEITQMLSRDRERVHAEAFARVWALELEQHPDITKDVCAVIEVGLRAQLYKLMGGNAQLLGRLDPTAAKSWAVTLLQ